MAKQKEHRIRCCYGETIEVIVWDDGTRDVSLYMGSERRVLTPAARRKLVKLLAEPETKMKKGKKQ